MADSNTWLSNLIAYCQKSFTSNDRWLLGVCSGIANNFNLDPALVRAITLILGIFSIKLLAIVYLVVWLIWFRNMD